MGDAHIEPGRFGHNRGVGVVGAQERHGADAGVFFVDHGSEEHIAAAGNMHGIDGGTHTGSHAGLHVIGAAAIQAIAIDAGGVGIGHARYPNGIGVAIEDERLAAAVAFGDGDDICAPWHDFLELDAQAGTAERFGNI